MNQGRDLCWIANSRYTGGQQQQRLLQVGSRSAPVPSALSVRAHRPQFAETFRLPLGRLPDISLSFPYART